MRGLALRSLIPLSVGLWGAALQGIEIERNAAVAQFPDFIRFELSAAGGSVIEFVELEFGTDAESCGASVSRAYPEDFEPSAAIEVEWTWDLRRTGALPPGTRVWWRWRLRDEAGQMVVTGDQELVFEHAAPGWQTRETEDLVLHWSAGSTSFASSLIDAGEQALASLEATTGVVLEAPVRVYVYASSERMQEATLFAPDWSGGLAFASHRTVLLGIAPESLEWGRSALAHELSHVVIGAYTFSCVESTPIWIDEGLAMYVEGELDPFYAGILEQAIRDDRLLSVRELGSIFSDDPDLALQAYAQSYSLVQFLVEEWGQTRLLGLLDQFRAGAPEDRALDQAYGFDRDGLEAEWRAWIGAPPMRSTAIAGPTPTRTPYPTFAPIGGPEQPATETPPAAATEPTPPPQVEDAEATGEGPEMPTAALIALAAICGLGVIVTAGIGLGLLLRARRARARSPRRDGS